MKVRCIARILFLLLPLIFSSGCATKALWDNENLEAVKEPADKPNLRLFDAKHHDDLLVVYDEYSERNSGIRTRAYWLNQNQSRVDQGCAPHFANPGLIRQLSPVPVFYAYSGETNWTFALYAVVETNRQSFTLYYNNGKISRHDLPTYNDGTGRMEKIALTPFAVTADLTIIGGYLGVWFLYGLAESGDNTSWSHNH